MPLHLGRLKISPKPRAKSSKPFPPAALLCSMPMTYMWQPCNHECPTTLTRCGSRPRLHHRAETHCFMPPMPTLRPMRTHGFVCNTLHTMPLSWTALDEKLLPTSSVNTTPRTCLQQRPQHMQLVSISRRSRRSCPPFSLLPHTEWLVQIALMVLPSSMTRITPTQRDRKSVV